MGNELRYCEESPRKPIEARRVLVRELRFADGAERLVLIWKENGHIVFRPFDFETHSTYFVDSLTGYFIGGELACKNDDGGVLVCLTGEETGRRIVFEEGKKI